MQPASPAKRVAQVAALTLLVGLIALASIWARQPWLEPSLGSAAVIQILTPSEPTAKPWPIAGGLVIGLAAGFAGVYLAAAAGAPPFTAGHPLVYGRVVAVLASMALTGAIQILLKAPSAPGGATALLLALGSDPPTVGGLEHIVVGIALVAALGEAMRMGLMRMA